MLLYYMVMTDVYDPAGGMHTGMTGSWDGLSQVLLSPASPTGAIRKLGFGAQNAMPWTHDVGG